MTDLSELVEAKSRLDNLAKTAADTIGKAFQAVLKECPNICVNWCQYRPAFNDGDPCRFSVGEFYIYQDGDDPSERSIYENDDKLFVNSYPDPDTAVDPGVITLEQYNKLEEIWNSLDNYILEMAFEEDSEITISSEEITIEEYSCGY